jgi:hypothetical protein
MQYIYSHVYHNLQQSNPIRTIIHNQDVELTFLFNCNIEQHIVEQKVKDYAYHHLFILYSGNIAMNKQNTQHNTGCENV